MYSAYMVEHLFIIPRALDDFHQALTAPQLMLVGTKFCFFGPEYQTLVSEKNGHPKVYYVYYEWNNRKLTPLD